MPRFSFFDNDNENLFQCNLRCQRCEEMTNSGTRCRKITCKSLPVCYIHLRTRYGLRIGPSTIPDAGEGLFAMQNFDAGEKICDYTGEIITDEVLDNRYGIDKTAPYAVYIDDDLNVDGACERGIAAWINQAEYNDDLNAELVLVDDDPDDKYVAVFALVDIEPGEEIFVDYSRIYNFNENVTYRTKPYN